MIPSAVREAFEVSPGDFVEWTEGREGVLVRFRKKKKLRDLTGIGGAPADAVEVKKRVQRGTP